MVGFSSNPFKKAHKIQQREWEPNVTREELRSKFTSTGKELFESADGQWEWLQFFGIFRSEAKLIKKDGDYRIKYQCYKTKRGNRWFNIFGLGMIVAIGIIAYLLYKTYGSVEFEYLFESLGSSVNALLLLGSKLLGGLLLYFYHGPSPPFETEGLIPQYTTFTWLYFVVSIVCIPLVFLNSIAALNFGIRLLITIIAGLMFYTHYLAAGSYPELILSGDELLPAGEPLISEPYPHLSVAVLALLPGFFTFQNLTIQSAIGISPSGINPLSIWLLLNVALPTIMVVVYCYWCYKIFKSIQKKRINPYRGTAGRLIIFGGFLLVNFITITFISTMFATLAPIVVPRLYWIDIPFSFSGFGTVSIVLSILTGTMVIGTYFQSGLETAERKLAARIKRGLRGINIGLSFIIFLVLTWLINMALWGILVPQQSLWNLPLQAIRGTIESELLLSQVFPGNIVGRLINFLSRVVIAAPVLLVAGLWAVHIQAHVDRYLRPSPGELDLPTGIVPESVTIRLIDEPIIAQASGRLLRQNQIEVGERFKNKVDQLEETEFDEFAEIDELPPNVRAVDVMNALVAHELYHLENKDHVVSIVARLSAVIFGGQNVLLSFYNLAESERAADRYAADLISEEALEISLKVAKEIKSDKEFAQRLNGPGLIGTGKVIERFGFESIFEANGKQETALRVIERIQWLVLMPYQLLFGSVIYERSHLSPQDRLTLLNLPEEISSYLKQQAVLTTVYFPTSDYTVAPVERSAIHTEFKERGASIEEIDTAIETLVANDAVRLVGEDYIQIRE